MEQVGTNLSLISLFTNIVENSMYACSYNYFGKSYTFYNIYQNKFNESSTRNIPIITSIGSLLLCLNFQ